jgi:hypothetical protein
MWDRPVILTSILHSKGTKGINVRPETLRLAEENVGETLQDTGINNDFSG